MLTLNNDLLLDRHVPCLLVACRYRLLTRMSFAVIAADQAHGAGAVHDHAASAAAIAITDVQQGFVTNMIQK